MVLISHRGNVFGSLFYDNDSHPLGIKLAKLFCRYVEVDIHASYSTRLAEVGHDNPVTRWLNGDLDRIIFHEKERNAAKNMDKGLRFYIHTFDTCGVIFDSDGGRFGRWSHWEEDKPTIFMTPGIPSFKVLKKYDGVCTDHVFIAYIKLTIIKILNKLKSIWKTN